MANQPKQAPTPPKNARKIDTEIDQYPDFKWEPGKLIEGKVLKHKTGVKVQRKNSPEKIETQLCIVETADGIVTLWETAGLKTLMDDIRVGESIWIYAHGKEELGQGREMWNFEAYVF